jgi:hypothetical protein
MRRIGLLAIVFLAVCVATPVVAETAWLPLKKAEVIRILAEDAGIDAVTVETLQQMVAKVRDSDPERARKVEAQQTELTNLFAPDDQVWVATNPGPGLSIVLAGRDEHVHSLRVPVVILEQRKVHRAYAVVSAIYHAVYPTWTEAKEWPVTSVREAWRRHPLNDKRPPLDDANDVIVKRSIGGITSATFGALPDLVVYAITARKQCIPFVDRGNPLERHNPLGRVIC